MLRLAPVAGLLLLVACSAPHLPRASGHDYGDALNKALLFLEAQRAGRLPQNQRVTWRKDSALRDGQDVGADLSKGYYDAGDNVKFGFPMAFTLTCIAWSVVEFRDQLGSTGQLGHALDALRWGTDFFLAAHASPNVLHSEVGDGASDHSCWMRPEDMTTSRKTYTVSASNPGTEVAAEAAAALAAASLAFSASDGSYAGQLRDHAKQLFDFADKYRGTYSDSIPVVRAFYQSFSGYKDELLWAAAWLLRATGDQKYQGYLDTNGPAFGGTMFQSAMLTWDTKWAGVQVLMAQMLMDGQSSSDATNGFWKSAQNVVCTLAKQTPRTPGGLLFFQEWSNLQCVTTVSLALLSLADHMDGSAQYGSIACQGQQLRPDDLRTLAKSQIDYILGTNPRGMSYMVGYGSNYPKRAHHRASSLPSLNQVGPGMQCNDGWPYYASAGENPNLLVGAVVGGPGQADDYSDRRDNFKGSEPTTYINAPLVGALARLAAGKASGDPVNVGKSSTVPGSKGRPNGPSRNPTPAPKPQGPSPQKRYRRVGETYLKLSFHANQPWSVRGKQLRRYTVAIRNKSKSLTVSGIVIVPLGFRPLRSWGLTTTKVGRVYQPAGISGRTLRPGRTCTFGYTQAGGPAQFAVYGYVPM